MRSFESSQKSKKTVASMIENKKDDKKAGKGKENKAPKGRFITVWLYNHICYLIQITDADV